MKTNVFEARVPGLIVTEATHAEWLAAGGSPLAGATLEPMTGQREPAQPVTLSDGKPDVFVHDIWRLNNGR